MAAHRLAPALAVLMYACAGQPSQPPHQPRHPDVVATYASPMWYEETGSCFQLSPDGRRATYGTGPRSRVYALPEGREITADPEIDDKLARLAIPPKAVRRVSQNGSALAYFVPGESTIAVGSEAPKTTRLDGAVNGLSWTPAGDALYSIVLHPDGLSSLERISVDGNVTSVRQNLDASPFFNTLAFSADGATVYLSLASESVPDVAERHDPEAKDRDLDIYALDLQNKQLRLVMRSEGGDDFCPQVAAGSVYWTHNDPAAEVVSFPIGGGELRAVADHGFLPRWSPDGRQIAFTRGYHRLADYGLDMDGWVVGVDAAGQVLARPHEWITGFGEDMGPVWSPDGRWVAYHSHRSATAVPLYESPGRTDDIWLKRVSGGPEIRLTDFGFEVGPPDWAPDGRHLIFDSWDKDGVPRFAKPWIITIDPSTGQPLGSKRMPLPPGVAGITGESWSPHGDDIAFVERIDGTKRALWISRTDGSGARKLVEFQSYTIGGVAWTPDGKELLYGALADDRMQIFAVSREGGPARQLTHDKANVMHPSVSPDGRSVAASRIPWRKELWRMTP